MEFMTVQQINEKLITLTRNERKLTEEILNHIILFQKCGGYLKLGFSSMHQYLTKMLGYSDDQSYRRLKAAKLMQEVPEVANQLKAGNLNLSQAAEVQKAIETSQKETGEKVATDKKKEIIKSVEKTNNFETKSILANELNLKPKENEKIIPQSNHTIRVEINLTPEQFEKLKTIKSLLSHQIPDQNTGKVLEVLMDQYLNKNSFSKSKSTDRLEKPMTKSFMDSRKNGDQVNNTKSEEEFSDKPVVQFKNNKRPILFKYKSETPQEIDIPTRENLNVKNPIPGNGKINSKSELFKPTRYIPVSIKQDLFKRANGYCEFINKQGLRCNSRYQLEVDHWGVPFSQGGDHSLLNLRLHCSSHNSYRASLIGIGYETKLICSNHI